MVGSFPAYSDLRQAKSQTIASEIRRAGRAGGPFKSSFDLSGAVRGSHRVGPLLVFSFSPFSRINFHAALFA